MDQPELIEFQGERYWLLPGGSITTPDDFRHGRPSYAHLFPDGRILRFRQQIGTAQDIIRLGPVDNELAQPEDIVEWIANMRQWAPWSV